MTTAVSSAPSVSRSISVDVHFVRQLDARLAKGQLSRSPLSRRTHATMVLTLETVVAVLATIMVTLGLSWLLYPAWVVLVAEKLEWTVECLDDDDVDWNDRSNNSSNVTHVAPLLSLVIPAYNEEDRIPIMLEAAFDYLTSSKGKSWLRELQSCDTQTTTTPTMTTTTKPTSSSSTTPGIEWLIVNDGSSDDTCRVVKEIRSRLSGVVPSSESNSPQSWKIVILTRNSGKGAAVKTGMNLATGRFRLMVDADGATDFGPGLEALVGPLKAVLQERDKRETIAAATKTNTKRTTTTPPQKGMVAVFGSRAHMENESTAQRSFIRTLLMHAFHFFVSLFVSSRIRDTQCGFKLFTAQSSAAVFGPLHLRRWAFDTEVVLLCDRQAIQIVECPVPWNEVDGSKLSTSKLALAIVSITMLRDMICADMCYKSGIWKV